MGIFDEEKKDYGVLSYMDEEDDEKERDVSH